MDFQTKREVSGSDGAVYEVTTSIGSEESTIQNEYQVNIAVVDTPEDWDLQTGSYPEWAHPTQSDEGFNPLKDSVYCTPEIPSTHTRATVPIEFHRMANRNATPDEDRRKASIKFVLPQRQAVETAVTLLRGIPNAKDQLSVERLLDQYQRIYECSPQSAYATWLYDVALVLSDETYTDFVTVLNREFGELDGVLSGILSIEDVYDTGERIVAMKGESPDAAWEQWFSIWLDDNAYICVPVSDESQSETEQSDSQITVRDWKFRQKVLSRYGYACSVCGLQMASPDGTHEVEAAHVQALEHGGSNSEMNGIPLCHTHHWAYDNGWLAFSDEWKILVRECPDVDGYEHLKEFHGESIKLSTENRPRQRYSQAHRRIHEFEDSYITLV